MLRLVINTLLPFLSSGKATSLICVTTSFTTASLYFPSELLIKISMNFNSLRKDFILSSTPERSFISLSSSCDNLCTRKPTTLSAIFVISVPKYQHSSIYKRE
ncbi:hypothetical protein V8G54_022144 [Vigna mungo]|uniref:Secreted protein n=1 Tax=Vigna mungo TaxID=3915 RepID=A0AAQ3NIP0_VIGMU